MQNSTKRRACAWQPGRASASANLSKAGSSLQADNPNFMSPAHQHDLSIGCNVFAKTTKIFDTSLLTQGCEGLVSCVQVIAHMYM